MSSLTQTSAAPAGVQAGVAMPPHLLRRALDACYDVAGTIGAWCIAGICVLMIVQSLGRQFGFPTGATNDVVAWLCAAAAFLTMAHAFKHGDFVRVTLVLEKLAPAPRRRFEIACLTVAVFAIGYLTWWACAFTYESWKFHEVAQGLWAIPIWIPQLSFAIGSVLFFIAVVDEWWIVARGGIPTFVRLVEERHAKGDFSSDL